MKKLILIPTLLFVLALNLTSCDTGESSSSNADPQRLINTAKSGTWRIDSYSDGGTDETSHFTGYNFTFSSSDAVTATNGTVTNTGTWFVRAIPDDEGNPTANLQFNLGFTSPVDFQEISYNWYVTSFNGNTIYLVNLTGTDILVLKKN